MGDAESTELRQALQVLTDAFNQHIAGAGQREQERDRRMAGVEARMTGLEQSVDQRMNALEQRLPAMLRETNTATLREVLPQEMNLVLDQRTTEANAEQWESLMKWVKRTCAAAASGTVLAAAGYVTALVLR